MLSCHSTVAELHGYLVRFDVVLACHEVDFRTHKVQVFITTTVVDDIVWSDEAKQQFV